MRDEPPSPRLRKALERAVDKLIRIGSSFDPVLRPDRVFDPSEPNTAGRIVALTLVGQERRPLFPIAAFYGSGVYAIYYRGDFELYRQLAATEHPIYVGKADPAHPSAKDALHQGTALWRRLVEHAKNIRKANSTLRLEDFDVRYLIVQSGFQLAAEQYLINFFRPIWNSQIKIAFGLGKHGDAATTRGNQRSPWDTLHPGRSWADQTMRDQKTAAQIASELEAHFSLHAPHRTLEGIVNAFLQEMRQFSNGPHE